MDMLSCSCPELLLSVLCFFLLFLLNRRRNACGALTNWPIVGMLPGLAVNVHRIHDFFTDILGISGCTYLFLGPWFSGMKLAITCDPANVNHVFNVNFRNYPKGRDFSEIFDIFGDGIFNADGDSWRIQRKNAQILMSQPNFRSFVARCCRDKVDNFLLPFLREVSEQGKAIDLQDVFLRLSFDITCILVFGDDPTSLTPDLTVVPFAKAIDDAMAAVLYRNTVPAAWWKLMRRFNICGERRMAEALKVIDDFITGSIDKRKQERFGCDSLLKSYIACSNVGGESGSDKFLRDTTLNLMIAGRDTIGVALAWFFYLLFKNRHVEEKLLEELRRGDGGEGVYLHAALCEALRLYPPVPFESKGVAEAEMLPSGLWVDPGTQILFSVYTMARMEGVWGKDCTEFRPERWISENERLRHEPAYKFMSFNCGPRTCLGKEIAFTELKAAAAATVREFRMEIVEGHPVEPKVSIILQMKNGLMVKVSKREIR